jgi:hypothetical protein
VFHTCTIKISWLISHQNVILVWNGYSWKWTTLHLSKLWYKYQSVTHSNKLPCIFQACGIDIRKLSMKTNTTDVTSMSLLNIVSKWKFFFYSGIPFLFEDATISVHFRWIFLTVLHLMDKCIHHLQILCCFHLFELKFNLTHMSAEWFVRWLIITFILQEYRQMKAFK